MPKGRFAKDLTGQTFGLLTVARRARDYGLSGMAARLFRLSDLGAF